MNNEVKFPQLPFLTRMMLKFGNTAKLELVLSSTAAKSAELVVKGITQSGVISMKQDTRADSVKKTTISQIDDIPIMIGIETTKLNTYHGSIFASLALRINGQIIFTFLSGFITNIKGLSWPNSNLQDTIPGKGIMTKEISADPAAGANATISVPPNELWKIRNIYMTFVTDATVANRKIHITITGQQTGINKCLTTSNQTANKTIEYFFQIQNARASILQGNHIISELPAETWIDYDSIIETDIANLQAGDNLSVMTVGIEKFFTGEEF